MTEETITTLIASGATPLTAGIIIKFLFSRLIADLDEKLSKLNKTLEDMREDIHKINVKIAVNEANSQQNVILREDVESTKEKITLLTTKINAAWSRIDTLTPIMPKGG